jgi:hypothetical protein
MADTIDDLVRNASDAVEAARTRAKPVAPCTPWPDPVSLDNEHGAPAPYPVEHLPPIIRNAVLIYQRYGQQPVSLVASSALQLRQRTHSSRRGRRSPTGSRGGSRSWPVPRSTRTKALARN